MKSIKSEIKHLLGMDRNSIDALRSRGVRIGKNCSINTNYIDYGHGFLISMGDNVTRSEERRVGKECRSRWSPYH